MVKLLGVTIVFRRNQSQLKKIAKKAHHSSSFNKADRHWALKRSRYLENLVLDFQSFLNLNPRPLPNNTLYYKYLMNNPSLLCLEQIFMEESILFKNEFILGDPRGKKEVQRFILERTTKNFFGD